MKCTITITYNPTSVSSKHLNLNHSNSNYKRSANVSINTSNLQNCYIHVIYLKNIIKEISCVFKDNNIQMNVKNVGDFGNKFLVTIPSVGHLRYVKFK